MAIPDDHAREVLRERPAGIPVLHMRWEKLLFLHWRWDAADLQARLPEGLTVDTFEGSAWLGIVPFYMSGVRPTALPAVPWLSNFLELNVRTYVYDRHGRPGVWFFSLACEQPVAVEIARRTFGLNYVHARMSTREEDGGWLSYRCQRREAGLSQFVYRPTAEGREAAAGTLEVFLVERYLLFARTPGGRLVSGRVHHHPYVTVPGEVRQVDFAAAVADGFEDLHTAPDHVLTATTLDVAAWPVAAVPDLC